MECQACGSSNVKKNGTKLLSGSIRKQRYLCNDCGKTSFYNSAPVIIEQSFSSHNEVPDPKSTVFFTGRNRASATIVIPQALVKKHAISAGDKLTFKEARDGILISKEVQA